MIAFLSLSSFMISTSFSSRDVDASTTYKIKSASFALSFARPTPIFSTTSSVARIPAVSTIRREIPPRLMYSSRISLVVPAISVTMALFSPTSRFKREDFPAFGLPKITVLIPSLIIFPSDAVDRRRSTFASSSSTSARSSLL